MLTLLVAVTLAVTAPQAPARVDLIEPGYRGWLFPDQDRIVLALRPNPEDSAAEDVAYRAVLEGEGASLTFSGVADRRIVLDAPALPAGDLRLTVTLRDGPADAGPPAVFSLRKLTRQQVSALPAYLDTHDRLVWKGKPFFVNGWYSDGDLSRLQMIAESPFNAVLDYGMTARPLEKTRRYLDEAERLGVAVILCINDVYPSATYRTKLGDWEGNDAIVRGVVREFAAHPALIAWYTNDEIPFEKQEEIEGYYRTVLEVDPGHPQLMVHHVAEGCGVFERAADLLGLDRYPVPRAPLRGLYDLLEEGYGHLRRPRPLWGVVQNFAWYQHRDVDGILQPGDRETPRARLPTRAEWEAGRPPTLDEYRAMTYSALVQGVGGLLNWCLYNLDFLPDRRQRWSQATEVAAEVSDLADVLLATDRRVVRWDDAGILSVAKRHGGKLYVLAVNPEPTATRTRAKLPLGSATSDGESPSPKTIEVLFEDRSVFCHEGVVVDFFPPFGRHVYVVPEPASPAVSVEFRARVPQGTEASKPVFVSGSVPELGSWSGRGLELQRADDGTYHGRVQIPGDTPVEYKLTRGSWAEVETGADGRDVPNREFVATSGAVVEADVIAWRRAPAERPSRTATLSGRVDRHDAFPSEILGNERTILVYVPPEYDRESERRYPVLYMHDGQNLFDEATAFGGTEWGVDETAERLIRQGRIEPLFVVAIYNNQRRAAEYTPSKDKAIPLSGDGDRYGRFLVEELKPFIDRHYRTRSGREDTAIAGSSLGGLISLHLASTQRKVWGKCAALSPSLWWERGAVLEGWRRRAPDGAFRGTRLWVDHGAAEGKVGDDGLPQTIGALRRLVEVFDRSGLLPGRDYYVQEVTGGRHNEASWAARIDRVLLFLFGQAGKE